MKKLMLALTLLLGAARPLAAQSLLVETATYNPSASSPDFIGVGDYEGWYDEWIMVTFHVSARTAITRVGIANVLQYDASPLTLFAAIVPVNADGVPNGAAPFNDADVLAHTLFVPDGTDQKIPLAVTLDPGDYAVVFGGGRFGATGYGKISYSGQTPLGSPSMRVTDNYYYFYDYDTGQFYWPTVDVWSSVYGTSPLAVRITVEAASDTQAMLDAVATRASQASVDTIIAGLGALATKTDVAQATADITSKLSQSVATQASVDALTSTATALAAKQDLLLSRPADGQQFVLETAAYNPGDHASVTSPIGATADHEAMTWMLGSFHVSTKTRVSHVGLGAVTPAVVDASSSLFAAIVRATPDGIPASGKVPFDDSDVLAHTLFVPDGSDQMVPLDAVLDPGDYAVVFGGGKWGAAGYYSVNYGGQTPLGSTTLRLADNYFYDQSWPTLADWEAFYQTSAHGIRMVVEAGVTSTDVMDAVGTRASQASVDGVIKSLGTLATGDKLADVATAVGTISQAVQTLSFDRSGLATTADVSAVSAQVSDRATQKSVDDAAASINLSLQMAIERALADGVKLPSIFLPQESGGHLEEASSIVGELIRVADESGVDVIKARSLFARGEALRTSSSGKAFHNWKNAFDAYAAAFQLLTR